MKLSVVIPAYDEEGTVGETTSAIATTLSREGIDHEVIVIDDSSNDGTAGAVRAIASEHPTVRCIPSSYQRGYGFAVRSGLEAYEGDAVAIMMADGSTARRIWSPTIACLKKATSALSARALSMAQL